jgi:hypothetical protein
MKEGGHEKRQIFMANSIESKSRKGKRIQQVV